MKATLVTSTDLTRIYRLSERITKGKNHFLGEFDIDEYKKEFIKLIRPEMRHYLDDLMNNEGVEYVAMSDARTRDERIMFVAVKGETFNRYGYAKITHIPHICGELVTSLNRNKYRVHPDEVYLRRIAQINHKVWEGLE